MALRCCGRFSRFIRVRALYQQREPYSRYNDDHGQNVHVMYNIEREKEQEKPHIPLISFTYGETAGENEYNNNNKKKKKEIKVLDFIFLKDENCETNARNTK